MVNALAATSQPTLKGVTCFASIMMLPLLPVKAFAVGDTTTTVFGLTVTGPSGGFDTHDDTNAVGAIMIKSAGTYTISGTYVDTRSTIGSTTLPTEYWWSVGSGANGVWRGIIDTTQASGDVRIILNNVDVETSFAQNVPMLPFRIATLRMFCSLWP